MAQLRLLILTPAARGRGLGERLIDECIAFARGKGYRKLMLWTQSHLLAARAIYRSRGFQVRQERALYRLRPEAGQRSLGAEAIATCRTGTVNWPLLAAAATGVQVGAAIVASRFAVAEVPPLTLAMLRYAIGFCCLLPFAWRGARELFGRTAVPPVNASRWRDLLAMAALGIGQFGVLIALLNFGLQHIGAAQAALIFSLFPLLTLLLAAALGRERITWHAGRGRRCSPSPASR